MDNQNPQFNQPSNNGSSNGISVAALVCGIIGIIGSFIPYVVYASIIFAILAVIFGSKGMKQAKETGNGKGLAVAGLVLGIISLAFTVIAIICAIALVSAAGCALAGAGL